MNKNITKVLVLATAIYTSNCVAASIEKASMFTNYGLKKEAKLELINIIYSKSSDKDKAEAYYLLGAMAFDENNITIALKSWESLSKKYPASQQAKLISDRVGELAEIDGEAAKESIDNAVALSYLRHGDFWSRGKDSTFTIDSSWMPNVESAMKWYDKVIKEFPNTAASKVAYQDKLLTMLGWKERGKYGDAHGIKNDFGKYMPLLLNTFKAFEAEHPKASTLQAFRYQIAQAYWAKKDWRNTREWLNQIIELAGEKDSFYKDTAQRRLKKVEY